ncbi:MAG: ABC transporter ATP-binding protein [Promethearchaeati archaeon SRVP18_Atabeyarchaeia-1]
MTSAIDVEDLTFSYRGSRRPAIRNVNMTITDGEYIVVTGPTGCGKTTLCRCFNGLIPHFHQGKMNGKVVVGGIDTAESKVSDLSQRVGFVFQDPENQLVALNVERELAFAPENLGLPREEIRERVEESIKMVEIDHLRGKAPYELSGGEQQRVAIAAVLTLKPKILVLDEPTSNLDPLGAKKVVNLLGRLNHEHKMTIVLIEHRLDLVAPFSNRILVMNDGEIAVDGEPRKVLSYDLVERLGIGIPRILKLFKELRIDDANHRLPLTPDEAVNLLV